MIRVYWSAPHRFTPLNERVKKAALRAGVEVFVPGDIDPDNTSLAVRDACIGALSSVDVVIVSLDCYGMDTAWEIGFAAAREIPTVGVFEDVERRQAERQVRGGEIANHWMHDWARKPVAHRPDDLLRICSESRFASLYVSSSTKELSRADSVMSVLAGLEPPRRVVTSRDVIHGFEKLSRAEYPPVLRDRCVEALRAANAVVVDAIDLAMNSSWEVGFADGLGTPVVGAAFLPAPTKNDVRLHLSDYWTHGWTRDNVVVGLDAAFERAMQVAGSSALDKSEASLMA
ncbi:MAG TPA: nucleoside 2-deoxyribosyltransferase [Thermoanaerobaculia bacterium]|nr:nucleoside 2-deoxyribosyltransferase [Thermoanaerobaculia bacterium]